jgi:hypothetical protein
VEGGMVCRTGHSVTRLIVVLLYTKKYFHDGV